MKVKTTNVRVILPYSYAEAQHVLADNREVFLPVIAHAARSQTLGLLGHHTTVTPVQYGVVISAPSMTYSLTIAHSSIMEEVCLSNGDTFYAYEHDGLAPTFYYANVSGIREASFVPPSFGSNPALWCCTKLAALLEHGLVTEPSCSYYEPTHENLVDMQSIRETCAWLVQQNPRMLYWLPNRRNGDKIEGYIDQLQAEGYAKQWVIATSTQPHEGHYVR